MVDILPMRKKPADYEEETAIERHLVVGVKKKGGHAFKVGVFGLPDRLVLWPDGVIEVAEVKTITGRLTKLQQIVFPIFAKLGHPVPVLRSKAAVDEYLRR